jgi:spore coat protein U-like protein
MRKTYIAPLAAGLMLALAGTAQAATKTASFVVSASVGKNCVISATPMNLGTFVGDNDLTATSDILVRCTNGTAYNVVLSTGSSGNYTTRTLTYGSDTLVYSLYTDDGAGNSSGIVWGDDSGATDYVTGTGSGMGIAQERTIKVHGELLAADNTGPVAATPVGSFYTDSIIATITY